MNEFFTHRFVMNHHDEVEKGLKPDISEMIDEWLSKLAKPGTGLSVVGYVSIHSDVLITVRRWPLRESPAFLPHRSSPQEIVEPQIE